MQPLPEAPPQALGQDPFQVGTWHVWPDRLQLTDGARVVRLDPKLMALLCRLAASPSATVPRQVLLEEVWPGVVVGEDALNQAVYRLRKALGDPAQQPRYVETVPSVGYRLIAPVSVAATAAGDRPALEPGASRTGRTWRRRRVVVAALGLVAATALLAVAGRPSGAPHADGGAPDATVVFLEPDGSATVLSLDSLTRGGGEVALSPSGARLLPLEGRPDVIPVSPPRPRR
jgi:DNA-binding winged helix-turn-helix (wHTH) protein